MVGWWVYRTCLWFFQSQFLADQVWASRGPPVASQSRCLEKDIVREVARGDKPYLRKSTDHKAQIRKAFVQLSGLICALRSVDFLR